MDNKKKKKQEKSHDPQVEELKKEVEDYKSRYLRALADYQNLEKRHAQESQEVAKSAKKTFVAKLLPFLDNLDKAAVFIKDPGLKLIRDEFAQMLRYEGFEELQLVGREFDPQYAEAVEVVPGDKDNIIVEVVRKGYALGGKLLRPAQVIVTKKSV